MEQSQFQKNGYQIARGLIQAEYLYGHLIQLTKTCGLDGDGNKSSTIFYKDPVFEASLEELLPAIEKIACKELYKTYSMGRQYKKGDVLRSHRDRHACEVTVSICLGHEKMWPLWINDKNEKAIKVDLEPGDALIFKGIDHAHWRERNEGGSCSQLFLHYVDKNGPYAQHKDDLRKSRIINFRLLKREFLLRVQ